MEMLLTLLFKSVSSKENGLIERLEFWYTFSQSDLRIWIYCATCILRHFLWVISYDTLGFGDLCASEPLLSYVQVMSWHLFGKYFSLKICWSLPMDRVNNINNFDGGNGKGCFPTRVGYKNIAALKLKNSPILTRRIVKKLNHETTAEYLILHCISVKYPRLPR